MGLGGAPNGSTDVVLFHACIKGRAPTHLPGAQNALVTVRQAAVARPTALVAWYGCARSLFHPVADAKNDARQGFDIAS